MLFASVDTISASHGTHAFRNGIQSLNGEMSAPSPMIEAQRSLPSANLGQGPGQGL